MDGLAILRGRLVTNLDALVEAINGQDRAKSREAAAALPPLRDATAVTTALCVHTQMSTLRGPDTLWAHKIPVPRTTVSPACDGRGLLRTTVRWWDETIEEAWAVGTQRRLHRVDGPAVLRADGGEEWWRRGRRHRADGPALSIGDRREWRCDGHLHRVDGPARLLAANGAVYAEWHQGGKRTGSLEVDPRHYREGFSRFAETLVARGDLSRLASWDDTEKECRGHAACWNTVIEVLSRRTGDPSNF